jgi:DNA-binding transcriptional MocR family regulator
VVAHSNSSAHAAEVLSAPRFALLVDGWRDSGHGAVARRLAHAVRSRIGSGLLRPGAFLPPERALATALAVSRSTVVTAFDELRADGFIESRQGRGTWVAVADTSDDASPTVARRLLAGNHNLNLAASVPADASHLPDLVVDVADLTSVAPAHGYAPAGLPALREAIAARHTALGSPTTAGQVHVTNGAQHALDLALGAVTRRGDVVAIEDPTYVGIFDLLEARGLEPLPLPLELVGDASEQLVKLVRAGRARAVVLVPAVHSPTGLVRHRADLQRLALRLDALGLPVVEDNTVADLVYTGARSPSLATMCARAPVLSVESFSKVAWGGLRTGWLRGDAVTIERTVAERERTDFGTAIPSQVFALRLLDGYEALIGARRTALSRSAKLFARLVRRALPDWHADAPSGGLSTWVDIGLDAETYAQHAYRHGVTVAPGTSASRSIAARTHLRICFDRPRLELEAAVDRLARAAQDARGRR